MTAIDAPVSKLFDLRPVDEEDGLELQMISAIKKFNVLLGGKSFSECQRVLLEGSCDSMENHAEYNLAILWSILTCSPGDPKTEQFFQYLQVIVRDSYSFFNAKLRYLIDGKYVKMFGRVKEQLIWLLLKMTDNAIHGCDLVFHSLIRQMRTGDVSNMNLWLCDSLVNILLRNSKWLFQYPQITGIAFYAFSRLALDHVKFVELRNKEFKFLLLCLREKFDDCALIGRDFVRILFDLSKFPEFDAIWASLLSTSIATLSPTFKETGTGKKYAQSRLSPTMENYMLFMLERVKLGQQKRYQQWFQQMYLSTPENETLIPDLIRFICTVYHPSNEILASDIIPRFAVIGWLITSIKNPVVLMQARLCLFYDWMFFCPEKGDSIMNIEPALLLMQKSISRYPELTSSLIEFLYSWGLGFIPGKQEIIRMSLKEGMKLMLSKGVISNYELFASSPAFSEKIKGNLKELFDDGMKSQENSVLEDAKTLISSPSSDERISFSPNLSSSTVVAAVLPSTELEETHSSFSSPSPSNSFFFGDDDEADDDIDDADEFIAIRKVILGCEFGATSRGKMTTSGSSQTSVLDSEFFSPDPRVLVNFLLKRGSSVINEISLSVIVDRASKSFRDLHGILGNVDLVRKIVNMDGRFAAMFLRHCFTQSHNMASQKHDLELYKNIMFTGNEIMYHLHIWQTLYPNSYFSSLPRVIESFHGMCRLRGNWGFVKLIVSDARPQDILGLEKWILSAASDTSHPSFSEILEDDVYIIGFETAVMEEFLVNLFPQQRKVKGTLSGPKDPKKIPDWQTARILNLWVVECERHRYASKNSVNLLSEFVFKNFINGKDPHSLPLSLFNFWIRIRNISRGIGLGKGVGVETLQQSSNSDDNEETLEEPATKKQKKNSLKKNNVFKNNPNEKDNNKYDDSKQNISLSSYPSSLSPSSSSSLPQKVTGESNRKRRKRKNVPSPPLLSQKVSDNSVGPNFEAFAKDFIENNNDTSTIIDLTDSDGNDYSNRNNDPQPFNYWSQKK